MRDYILAGLFVLLIVMFLQNPYKAIYSKSFGKETIFDNEKKGDTEKDNVVYSSDRIPALNIYSELSIPDSFIAKKCSSKMTADYILVNESLLDKNFVFKPALKEPLKTIKKPDLAVKGKPNKSVSDQKEAVKEQPAQIVPKSQPELNYFTVKDIIGKSQNTYFYPDISANAGSISLKLISSTPFEYGKTFLKLQLTNNSKEYFFISEINITMGNSRVPIKTFGEQFVKNGESTIIYILLKDTSMINNKSSLLLSLYESGRNKQCLNLKFSLP